jgi:hypothetical protein
MPLEGDVPTLILKKAYGNELELRGKRLESGITAYRGLPQKMALD